MQTENSPQTETTLPGLIAELVPPPVPEAVSLWPQTPLAKALLSLFFLLLLFMAWRAYRHYRANAYRRAALKALAKADGDPGAIAEIIRRTALAVYPRAQAAGLTGKDWLAFLNHQYGGDEFHGDTGERLLRGAYQNCQGSAALTRAANNWIRRHRRELLPHESGPEKAEATS